MSIAALSPDLVLTNATVLTADANGYPRRGRRGLERPHRRGRLRPRR